MSKQRLVIVVILSVLFAGCAAGRAYRRGQEAARAGDWDAAVTHYTRAVQTNPESPEYKIALERAQQTAAQEHISRGRQLEEKDQLDLALMEYRRAVELDGTNRMAAARAAELERIIRDRIEASRPRPRIETLRDQAARQGPPPLLNLRTRLPRLNFNQSSVRDILNIIGTSAGISVTFDQQFADRAVQHRPRGRHRRGGAAADHGGEPAVLQGRQSQRRSSSSTIAPTSASSTTRWW